MRSLRITLIALSCLMAVGCCEEGNDQSTGPAASIETSKLTKCPATPIGPRKAQISLPRAISERMVSAFKFYAEDGIPCDKIPDQVKGIDLTQPVSVVVLKKGTKLIQWTYLDTANNSHRGKPIIGHYCTLPWADSSKLGIPLKDRVKTVLVLTEDTKFLQSVAADIQDWRGSEKIFSGGSVQLFQEHIKYRIRTQDRSVR